MGPLLVPKLYLGPLFKYLYENIIFMEHISLFEVIATGRIEDFTNQLAHKLDSNFQIVERDVVLQGRYEQLEEANGRPNPNIWRSIDHYDGFYYTPRELPEDRGAPDYEKGGFGSADVQGPVIWN